MASLSHNSNRHAVQYKRPVATCPPMWVVSLVYYLHSDRRACHILATWMLTSKIDDLFINESQLKFSDRHWSVIQLSNHQHHLMCRLHRSMIHNQLTRISRSNDHCRLLHPAPMDTSIIFSLHERRTIQTVYWVIIKAACMSGAVHTHPPHALWCLSSGSSCKCSIHLVSGTSPGAAWC